MGTFFLGTTCKPSEVHFAWLIGMNLNEVEQMNSDSIKIYNRIKSFEYNEVSRLIQIFVEIFGGEKDAYHFQSELEKITNFLPESKNIATTFYAYILFIYFLDNDLTNGLKAANSYVAYQQYFSGMYYSFFYGTLCCLIYIDIFAFASSKEQKLYWKYIKKCEKELKEANEIYSVNFAHLYFLLLAEKAKVKNNFIEAISYYDKAIEHAKINHFPNFVAIINERAGNYCLKTNSKFAKSYLQEAHYYYTLWGATVKAKQLEKQFSQIFREEVHPSSSINAVSISTSSSTDNIDLFSIIKSTQSISKEIVLDKLLAQLVHLVLENAGAQRCVFLSATEGPVKTIAEGYYSQDKHIFNLDSIPYQERNDLPKSVISYALRTKESLIIDDVAHDERFNKDSYFTSSDVKSVLYLPVLYHGEATAYLYLENNLTAYAFTKQRIQALNILAAQAAISLENSRLYTASNRFVPFEFLSILSKHNIVEVQLGDQVLREMTVLFCDIRSFTTISEKLTPLETISLINSFLKYMEPAITQHQGFIDKYIGDAIMALFLDADSAMRAALKMRKQLQKFNELREHAGQSPIDMGIGINTGELMLGILGSDQRIETSVIGDTVNIASRLESLTKEYHSPILISDMTKSKLTHSELYFLNAVAEVMIRGRSQPIRIWEVKDWSEAIKE